MLWKQIVIDFHKFYEFLVFGILGDFNKINGNKIGVKFWNFLRALKEIYGIVWLIVYDLQKMMI